MKRIRFFGIILLLLTVLLAGCSTEALMERGAELLDKMFAGEPAEPRTSSGTEPAVSSTPKTDPEPAGQEPAEPSPSPGAVEPSIPGDAPASQEPSDPEPSEPEPSSSTPAGNITPSHTDVTLFGPGESFK